MFGLKLSKLTFMEVEKSFGETIKSFRNKKGLTLKEVAEHLCIDTSMLGKIEKNKRKPSKEFIANISKFLSLDEKELTIAHLSDTVCYSIQEEDLATEVLKVAEGKIKYHKKNSTKACS